MKEWKRYSQGVTCLLGTAVEKDVGTFPGQSKDYLYTDEATACYSTILLVKI